MTAATAGDGPTAGTRTRTPTRTPTTTPRSGPSSADGGSGGYGGAVVNDASQNTSVSNSFSNVGNEDNDFTLIKDSFNQDNDGVDNSHGIIDDSVVAGDDIKDSLNNRRRR